MFADVGWGEVLVILLVAVIIFGPDKLPKLAADLARGIKMARSWAQRARSEFGDQLGPEFRDLDITALHPKTFVRKALLEDDDDPLGLNGVNRTNTMDDDPDAFDDDDTPTLAPGERAPYDSDAT